MSLDYLSDNLIELRGPVNIAQGAAVDESSTVNAKLYDTAYDAKIDTFETTLTEDAEIGAGSVFVEDDVPFAVGDSLHIDLDDGSVHRGVILTLLGSKELDFAGTLAFAASEGNRVTRARLDSTSVYLTLDNFGVWLDDRLEVTTTDGTLSEHQVLDVLADRGYLKIDVSPPLSADVEVGAIVKRRLGVGPTNDISMAAFGTFPTSNPVVGDPTWGFRGVIPHDYPDFQLGMRVRGEITLVDTVPSPDLNLTRKVVGTLINQ